jgi:CDP-diacylglycerol---glycerol-3-phosphate 3-phosphatidyltransferase
LAVISAIIVGREITISALREWMAEIGERARVRVAGIGKVKTIAQLVALVVLLYQKDLDGFGLFHVGEVLLGFAAALTIWSGVVYIRAAWPVLRAER